MTKRPPKRREGGAHQSQTRNHSAGSLIAIADRRGWVLGEVLEHALAALEATDQPRT